MLSCLLVCPFAPPKCCGALCLGSQLAISILRASLMQTEGTEEGKS